MPLPSMTLRIQLSQLVVHQKFICIKILVKIFKHFNLTFYIFFPSFFLNENDQFSALSVKKMTIES